MQDEALLALQRAQLEHDQKSHSDILTLRVHERVVHYVLHFSKYSGRLIDAETRDDQHMLSRSIVDAFIISLAFCNTLNLRMSDADEVEDECTSELIRSFAVVVGDLAKTTESIDHLETGNIRVELERQLLRLAAVVVALASRLRIDLASEAQSRWMTVDKKSIFYTEPSKSSRLTAV